MFKLLIDSIGRIALKYEVQVFPSGDGMMFSFPKTKDLTNLNAISDVLECSLKQMQSRKKLCVRLAKEGLPEISYRITIDYQTLFEHEPGDEVNVWGPFLIPLRRIGSNSPENIVVVGEELYKVVTTFSQLLQKYKFESLGNYLIRDKKPYSIYQLTLMG